MKILHKIENETRDDERAYYHTCNTSFKNCVIEGPADGESAFKESREVAFEKCLFKLRYPLWHVTDTEVNGCEFEVSARAPLWYLNGGKINSTIINGVKALRECVNVDISDSQIDSVEFGWKNKDLKIENTTVKSEYFLFGTEKGKLSKVTLDGKYSFQYTKGLKLSNCVLNTKDAFWHSKNVTVKNSVINGEYLGWYSENLTLINCVITGTQPLCYCKKLKLINCEMKDADLAFEYSDVKAEINGRVDSVKNPEKGYIIADDFGEVIRENSVRELKCRIEKREAKK